MVGRTMRKAMKRLDARKTRERNDQTENTKLAIIDPSHELSQQRQSSTGSISSQTWGHALGLQSNPDIHVTRTIGSSPASVYSLDGSSVSSLSTIPHTYDDELDDELDMVHYDVQMQTFPFRRRSTGSSRAKSQQKLARILGWNTSFPQWQPPTSTLSLENQKLSSAGPSSQFRRQSPVIWEDNTNVDVSTPDSMPDLRMRQYPARRANSMREYSTAPILPSNENPLRQFLFHPPQKDIEKSPKRSKIDEATSPRADSPGSTTPSRRNSNANIHKPLPNTPDFPTFPAIPPLQDIPTMTSTSTPTSAYQDDFLPNFELSAEEASILLAQPEPSELSTESWSERAELAVLADLLDPTSVSNVRSRSPTNARGGSAASQCPDFGLGTTLSIIEEEPFDADDLAKLKVFELPTDSSSHSPGGRLKKIASNSSGAIGGFCPGLSPSSSLSSRRTEVHKDDSGVRLELQADRSAELVEAGSDSITNSHANTGVGSENEGEETLVIFDRSSGGHTMDMTGKSFLALDEDDDNTDTENSYRNSIQSGESRFTSQPVQSLRSNMIICNSGNRDIHRRSTSDDSTKTAYTNRTVSTAKTSVGSEQDFSRDLAKMMDWL